MRVLSKITFESIYVVWKVIAKVAEYVYSLVCVLDKWMSDHYV